LNKLTIRKPDDFHVHLREGSLLRNVLPLTSRVFKRAIVMPNLDVPITSIDLANQYKKQIIEIERNKSNFEPLMTLYLTDNCSLKILEEGFENGAFFAAKLYPANATTNSELGVTSAKKIYSVFELMESIGMPLLIHGEVTDEDVDIFDRESVFIDKVLVPIINRFPNLKIVLEHITTDYAVRFVESNQPKLGATITPHHLHLNRNALFEGGLRSDYYCLPVVKSEFNRLSLIKAATSGKACFFLGTDSAPHLREFKESSCGCAGIFNAPYAIESYLDIFEKEEALNLFESFASINGARFYGLPLNEDYITIEKTPIKVPLFLDIQENNKIYGKIKIFHSSQILNWKVNENLDN
tara:strand:+ start:1212 stop:2273 length:1062 start_codon:yes stop_codon:yes gene_type:complete